jgi:5-oxoprolinase (ATP-hydrolysing) subunit B
VTNAANTVRRLLPAEAGAPARVHLAGSGALLLDVGSERFDLAKQRRVWSLAHDLAQPAGRHAYGVLEVVPGVNNLMVVFDTLAVSATTLADALAAMWDAAQPREQPGRDIEIPVLYGGAAGEDLPGLAQRAGLTVEEFARRHSAARYEVICLGAMPGFPYLAGLPDALAAPRRTSPRLKLPRGSVIIGGTQAAVLPDDGPCGWHVIGTADIDLFDPSLTPPTLLSPGDTVRFSIRGIESSP